MKTINCVIFDFGGVIGLPHCETFIKEMVSLTGVSREELLPDYFYYRKDYDQGITDTKAYWTQILIRHNVELTDELVEKLRIADASSWTQINPKTLDFIYKLKAEGVRIALLSNINYGALAYIEERFQWLNVFDERIYSCDLKLLKPDSKIYEYVLDKVGIDRSKCLFIDDSIENVIGARAVGMESIQFLEFDALIETINAQYLMK